MISRYFFVGLYFLSFFLLNRWYDFYQYYFHLSKYSSIKPIQQLSIKQLQYVLNLRGITYVNINDKYDLIKLVEQTGSVRENELSEPIEDHLKRQTTVFSSYRQLLDFVDDCKDTIWFIHLLPHEERRQSFTHLSSKQWQMIERRLSIFNIQTGLLNCSTREYSNLCRTLNTERFLLLVPSIHRRSTHTYFYDLYSSQQYDYQYILKWLSKTLEKHVQKDFDWYELPQENRSVLEFRIDSNAASSTLPIYYFPLLYRYGTIINFHLNFQENAPFQLQFSFRNSSSNIYIYNHRQEFYSYRSLNLFLACLTINIQTLMSMYFILLNIYFLYDIYFIQSVSVVKKILMINILSGLIWSISLNIFATEKLDSMLQMVSFYLMKFSQDSTILMYLRKDLFVYSVMSKWILYPMMIFIHIAMGLSFRWYSKDRFERITHDLPNDTMMIDRIHGLCSKLWQYILSFLFSDQGPNEHNHATFLPYFPQDSLWLNQYSLSTINSNVNLSIRPMIDFERLPVWRFTIRRRQTIHGAREYHSDIELEEENSTLKNSSLHRRMINQQENCYTSESDENNNSFGANGIPTNSSEIYQCSICLEKYIHHVYICTLPCLHHFHRKCLFDWLCKSEHRTCPLCRTPVMNE